MTTGLVIGKFYPLHAGHLTLIARLTREVDEVVVCVLAAAAESIPLETRLRWVRDAVPAAIVVGGDDEAPMGDTDELWAAHLKPITAATGRERFDVVATGDWYGPELARRLGARLLAFDPTRSTVPISATAIRADVAGHWWALPAAVRADLTRRVAVVGAESTGTTTIARALAEKLGTVWVPEHGRAWSGIKGPLADWRWESAEFDVIAAEQAALEDAAARLAGPVLICDTDVLATAIWHERYCGFRGPSVEGLAARRMPDLYLITGDEGVAWEDDGMRDGEDIREWMTGRFRERVAASGVPSVELVGDRDTRVAAALTAVEGISRWTFADPIGVAAVGAVPAAASGPGGSDAGRA